MHEGSIPEILGFPREESLDRRAPSCLLVPYGTGLASATLPWTPGRNGCPAGNWAEPALSVLQRLQDAGGSVGPTWDMSQRAASDRHWDCLPCHREVNQTADAGLVDTPTWDLPRSCECHC